MTPFGVMKQSGASSDDLDCSSSAVDRGRTSSDCRELDVKTPADTFTMCL
jgi:hypothetical protein